MPVTTTDERSSVRFSRAIGVSFAIVPRFSGARCVTRAPIPRRGWWMPADFDELIGQRGEALLRRHLESIHRRTDRLFAGLMVLQWLAAIAAAYWLSPLTWIGRVSQTHLHVWAAWILGGAITALPAGLALFRPGHPSTRYTVATGQMLMSALLIHLSGGRIETHFHVFGSLAFL